MKKYLQTHINDIVIGFIAICIWFFVFRKNSQPQKTYKEQAIQRVNLDSLKLKVYEEIRDSLIHADSLYKHKLSLMSAKERQQEFNRLFPK